MKKILVLLVVICMTLVVFACAADGPALRPAPAPVPDVGDIDSYEVVFVPTEPSAVTSSVADFTNPGIDKFLHADSDPESELGPDPEDIYKDIDNEDDETDENIDNDFDEESEPDSGGPDFADPDPVEPDFIENPGDEEIPETETTESQLEVSSAFNPDILPNRRLTHAELRTWATTYYVRGGANAFEHEVIRLVNIERTKRGLTQVTLDHRLSMAGRFHAQTMSQLNLLGHNTGPYADDPKAQHGASANVAKAFGGNLLWGGGNAAWGHINEAHLVNSWMNSPGHYAYIVSPEHRYIGTGRVGAYSYLFMSANPSSDTPSLPSPPKITTNSLPNGSMGTAYNQTVAATSDNTVSWAITNGALPPGLSLNSTTGVISGTPTRFGTSTFTIRARSTIQGTTTQLSDTKQFTIRINGPQLTLNQTSTRTFPAANYNYSPVTPFTVNVTNSGNRATGDLTVSLTGANTSGFVLSVSSLSDIVADGKASFTVTPVTGLNAGTYTARVAITGDNGLSAGFNVSFTVNRITGATVNAVPTVSGIPTHNSITINAVSLNPPNTGEQEIEYAIGTSTTAPAAASSWRTFPEGPTIEFTGLRHVTTYYVFARSKANTNSNAGTARRSAAITTPRIPGAAISGAPSVSGTPTHDSITVTAARVSVNPGSQALQYAITLATVTEPPTAASGWQTGRTFGGLDHDTEYIVWARTARNTNYEAGTAVQSDIIKTALGTFGMKLSRVGIFPLPAAPFNYGTQATQSVTVTNTGNQILRGLTIGITGADSGKFAIVSPAATPPAPPTLANIAVGGSRNFTIRPVQGLEVGTYKATVTVSSSEAHNALYAPYSSSFDVTITVNRAAGVAVRAAPVRSGSTFGSITVGEVRPVAANPGSQTVEYAISRTTGVPASGWQAESVFTNLLPSTKYYVFARTAANDNYNAGTAGRSAVITTSQAQRAITLSRSGTFTFGAANFGYSTRTPATITINNTGTSATGALTVSLSGEDADRFQLSRTTVPGIARNGAGSFTIRPVNGLLVGTYTAAVTVSNEHVERSFNIAFTVNRGTAAGAPVSGRPIWDENVPITPTGITVVPVTNAGLTGQDVQYAITTSTSNTAPTGGWQASSTFENLRHTTGYHVWARTAANNNYNAGPAVRSVLITTAEPDHGINLNIGRTNRVVIHTFGTVASGYRERDVTTATVTVVNAGSQPTGELEIKLSGPDAQSFMIVSPEADPPENVKLDSIDAGGNTTFTIRPKQGLRGGQHRATVAVGGTGSGGFSECFSVTLTVNRVAGAAVSGRPTVNTSVPPSSTSITVNELESRTGNGQTVQYAITTSASTTVPSSGWQDSPTFNNLRHTTGYHVWARTAANNNNNAGNAQRTSAVIRTEGITINRSGTHTFTQAGFNVNRAAISTRINNPGRGTTGELTITLSGAGAGNFTLSANTIIPEKTGVNTITISGVAASGSATFSVKPNRTTPAGTHRAAVTVSGDGLPARSFTVSYRVVRGTGATVGAWPVTPGISVTHNSISTETLTIPNNPGNQVVQYAITTSTSTSMPSGLSWQANPYFTGLRPSTGYRVWARTAQNTNCSAGTARRSAAIRTDAMPHCITLSRTGTHTFTAAPFNYGARSAVSTTVRNVGTAKQATGSLTVSLSGTDASSFEIVTPATGTLASIAHDATRNFTVRPKQGLAVGTYTATVTVSGNNGISGSLNLSFTVTMAAGATVSNVPVARTVTSNSITVNPVTVPLNPGLQTVEYAISTSTAATPEALNALIWQSGTTFPENELSPPLTPSTVYYVFARTVEKGSYLTGATRRSAAIRTNAPEFGITMSRAGEQTFPSASLGYGTRPAWLVTATNVGRSATGELTITITGTDSNRFEIVSPSASSSEMQHTLSGVAINGNRTFTIRPKTGSVLGVYRATVTVSGIGDPEGTPIPFSASFEVVFNVTQAAGAAVSAAPTVANRSPASITVSPVSIPVNPGNQLIEYAISRTTAVPATGWQSSATFNGLLPSTQYYVFARTAANTTRIAGAALRSALIHTALT